jgi:gliding motility-associated-like protein
MLLKRICVAILVSLFWLLPSSTYAQLEASNWYFGFGAGINFDPVTGNVTPLTNGQLNTNEGCASISDDQGNLLFYTDGITVYNGNHIAMPNGSGLLGNPSSTQSAIIIPKPLDSNIYYIFTVDTAVGAGTGAADSGLHYYEVDMTLDFGNGDVVTDLSRPNNLISVCSEKIAAINHETDDTILVTAYANSTGFNARFDSFYTFTISATGVDPTPVISTNFGNTTITARRGNLKISPDGRFMVSANMEGGTYLYDFNQTTGEVSNERSLRLSNRTNDRGYGVEFSPDSRLLYIAASNDAGGNDPARQSSTLYQFDLSDTAAISNTLITNGTEIDTRQGFRSSLQLGIDGKIYRSLAETFDDGYPFLGVINNPNSLGVACGYQHDAIPLAGRLSTQGLPPFIQSFFALIDSENLCEGDSTEFSFEADSPPDAVFWDFGDGTSSTIENPSHLYAAAGTYDVVLTLTAIGVTRIYRKTIEIYEQPDVNNVTPIELCDINNDGNEVIDLEQTVSPVILGTQDAATFTIRYFNTLNDAVDNIGSISTTYTLNLGTETIFARINNINNLECFETVSISLTLFEQPIANPIDDLEVCDDDFDGFIEFDLTDQNNDLLNGQDPSLFEITYHLNQTDADSGDNDLPAAYRNTTAFNQPIFVRIQNRNSALCADTSQSFNLVVNPKPVANNFDAFQCDEDGVADRRTVFGLASFDAAISGNASDVEVTYHLNNNAAIDGTNELDKISYRNLTPLQVVFARVTNTITECFTTSEVTLSVSASDARNTSLERCDDDGIEDGLTTFNLPDADSNVLANAPAGVLVNYYESLNDALTEQNQLPVMYENTVAGGQVIFARAESPDGNCFGISEVTLTVNDLPVIETYEFIEFCGSSTTPLVINSGLLTGTSTDYTYSWNTGQNTESIEAPVSGEYIVTVSDNNGCSRERLVEVVISELATIERIDVTNALSGDDGRVEITVSGNSEYDYSVFEGAGFQDEPVFENLPAGFYTIYVRDKQGCGVTTATFSIIGYPRFFTPNDDGFNDFWQIKGVSDVIEPDALIYIFDRYGKLLSQISASSRGWDGNFNGAPMPSSDYWFQATLSDGTVFSSHFTLKR